jgi:hypothetical protein
VTDLPDFPDDPLAIAHFPRGLLSDQVQPVALHDGDYILMDRRRCERGRGLRRKPLPPRKP